MIYCYDGTEQGFFTAFLKAYGDKTARLRSAAVQLALAEPTTIIKTDEALAQRVKERFLRYDAGCLHDLDRILRSGDEDKDETAFRYFLKIAEKKRPVREMLADEAVRKADECIRRVGLEVHRLHGFIRFMETASGALYAPFSPDNDVLELLVPHFRARFPAFPFVLHDVKRKKAAVWDGANVYFAPLGRADVLLSDDETAWRSLWKRYYTSVNIPSRERLKQMRGYLPVRYMKFMNEFFGN